METDRKVLELLEQKKIYFQQYEEETKKLNTEDERAVEQIAAALDARQRLIVRIDAVDEEIQSLCREEKNGERLLLAVRNQGDYEHLPMEYRAVYEAGQQVFQIIARIQNEEKLAAAGMQAILEKLRNKIRQNNEASKVSGYLKSMNYGEDRKKGFLYDEKR